MVIFKRKKYVLLSAFYMFLYVSSVRLEEKGEVIDMLKIHNIHNPFIFDKTVVNITIKLLRRSNEYLIYQVLLQNPTEINFTRSAIFSISFLHFPPSSHC